MPTYGFIHLEEKSNIFFHKQRLHATNFYDLRVGDLVAYDLGENEEGGTVAVNVQLV